MATLRRLVPRAAHPPVLDFLAPGWASASPQLLQRARLSTSSRRLNATTRAPPVPMPSVSAATSSAAPASEPPSPDASPSTKPCPPLTAAQTAYLTSALRVNQAGELAATLIYAQQTPILGRTHPHLRPLMAHMSAQEAGHFATFNALLAAHRIRPTALTPLWTVAASALGWGTALLGREAAMACTEAVETEIGEHYNGQVGEMLGWAREREERGEELPLEVRELLSETRRIRDEELEHLDSAVEQDAKMARPYEILTGVIRGGCRGAIWLTERV